MAKQTYKDKLIGMRCTECNRRNYYTTKKRHLDNTLELKKHCKWCRKHKLHVETRITAKAKK